MAQKVICINFFLLLNLTTYFLKSSYHVELCGVEKRLEFPLNFSQEFAALG